MSFVLDAADGVVGLEFILLRVVVVVLLLLSILMMTTLLLSGQAKEGVPDYFPIATKIINPKSISMNELYGAYDLQVRCLPHTWKGVLAHLMMSCAPVRALFYVVVFPECVGLDWLRCSPHSIPPSFSQCVAVHLAFLWLVFEFLDCLCLCDYLSVFV